MTQHDSDEVRSEQPAITEVHVSVPDSEVAQRIAQALVARQDAACVQVLGPMATVYAWKGEVHQAKEWLLVVKTTQDAFERVCELVRREHPYEVPEIVALPVVDVFEGYAAWVRRNSDGIDDEELLDT